MSLPFELRALAAKRSDVLAAMERIFAEESARVTTRLASIAGARTGSVGFPQRFGSSLNVHVHFHTLAIDGVFEKTAMGVRFHDAPPPPKDDVSEVARRVRERALLWLRRRGYIDERAAEERSNETIEPSALDACTQLALAGGAYLARPFEHEDARAFHDHPLSGGAPHPRSSELALAAPNGSTRARSTPPGALSAGRPEIRGGP
ncbi:transposase [Sorangium sp. So ce726]|uniref:transposase n=1 Tax=Sorangium sp. So ce726 TaxID=3133319 RepID=UPI003F641A6B